MTEFHYRLSDRCYNAPMQNMLASRLSEPEEPAPFLGVERSLGGKFWRQRASDERMALAISQRLQIPEPVGRLLASRGQTIDTAESFLTPKLRDLLPDPAQFRDMEAATERLAAAVRGGEQIAIFGDYDVDGATSAALLSRFLAAAGAEPVRLYVPDRGAEGYGPNAPALLKLKSEGANLVVTVDCGVTAFAPLQAAKAAGLDVIVVDHHVAEPLLPVAVAVVNPNRLDEAPGHGQMAAIGVAFLLVVALNRKLRETGWYGNGRSEPDLLQWLDIVALGTVCDVVPLTGINRALVAQGLKVLGQRRSAGLRALAEVAGINERVGAYHLGFLLGPRINAGGRVGRSDLGARLLSTDDPNEAMTLARELDALNTERREIEAGVLEEAIALADAQAAQRPHLIFVAAEGWHAGVIGIVAGRLKERYERPVCVVALENGIGKGSGRSSGGFHLGNAIIAARESGIVAKGGGHAMAAGFEVAADRIEDLRAFIDGRIGHHFNGAPPRAVLDLDGALQPRGASPDFAAMLERLAPFGAGNAEPRFALSNVRIAFADLVGDKHVRCQIEGSDGARIKGIAFRCAESDVGKALLAGRNGPPLHVAGHLRLDSWQGQERVQMTIEDAAKAG
jgi:single-stranded-DNA-specific exonuclease